MPTLLPFPIPSRSVPMSASTVANPLLVPWPTQLGVPPFADIAPEHFRPAFEQATAEHRAEIDRIAADAAAPTFGNTIAALENAGRTLERVSAVFWNLAGAHTDDALQAIEREMSPRLALHWNAITSNAALFARIDAVMQGDEAARLDPEQKRVLERTHLAFVRAGARLGPDEKKRLGDILERLATLGTQFSQNVLADERSYELPLAETDVAGLPELVAAAARRTAEERGSAATHVVTLSRSLIEPFLTFSPRRDLRERAFMAWTSRGENGGATDNRAIIAAMLALRRERARLLGYDTFADYKLDNTMAKSAASVRALLDEVWPAAKARADGERGKLQALAQSEGANITIEPWDWRYYADKVRKAEFDLDEAEVKPYLALDSMIEAAFYTAGRLFGLSFAERTDLGLYHPDVRAFEVTDSSGAHVGLFLGDYFARPSKRSGAWMSSYRRQERLGGDIRPIVVNVMNFAKGAGSSPPLLSFDDARTLFHEFGHALHGLLSDVTYPSLSGTSVARDFVELPSQLFEHWLSTREVLGQYARHYRTGEPMPDRMIDKLRAARTFSQGFATVEYLSSAIVDIDFHSGAYDDGDPVAFERAALARIGMPREIAMRHRTPHFSHIFSGDGYASGYYSYLWSEVLDADAFAAFEEVGDVFDPATAARLKQFVYGAGGLRDEEEAYLGFRGRMPSIEGLLKKRGLTT
ncbi:MAG: M3 family metallopeptidase [Hyphomicrobiaceae bacterium]|nr:M3 family metallopeptidase [Hyphomicrobiaceae bacterium]